MSFNEPAATVVAFSDTPEGNYHSGFRNQSHESALFRSAQWSADGTTLFTTSSTDKVCSFVVPHDLLEPRSEPATLRAYGTLRFPEPTYEVAPCPSFSLDSPETQVILAATRDHPIHLHGAFPPSPGENSARSTANPPPLAHYNLIKTETEQYLPVRSMIWPGVGSHFIAGTKDLLAVFDINRAEPVLPIRTIPSKRHRSAGHGIGMRGTVSALAAQPGRDSSSSLVAAGTWQRGVALYDLFRGGEVTGTWNVKDADPAIGGDGVAQIVWSHCGNYLVINERKATGLLVYDMRMTKALIATLAGRKSETHQQLRCDVFSGTAAAGGFEVWAGTQDGTIKVWEGVGNQEGIFDSTWDWQGHESSVGSTAVHSCGSVVATCSGERMPTSSLQRHVENAWDSDPSRSSSDGSESDDENSSGESSSVSSLNDSSSSYLDSEPGAAIAEVTSLKVWSIGHGNGPLPGQYDLDAAEA